MTGVVGHHPVFVHHSLHYFDATFPSTIQFLHGLYALAFFSHGFFLFSSSFTRVGSRGVAVLFLWASSAPFSFCPYFRLDCNVSWHIMYARYGYPSWFSLAGMRAHVFAFIDVPFRVFFSRLSCQCFCFYISLAEGFRPLGLQVECNVFFRDCRLAIFPKMHFFRIYKLQMFLFYNE